MNQRYAAYNASGQIIAFFDTKTCKAPEGVSTIEITDAEWQECLLTPGYTVVSGSLVAPQAQTGEELLARAQTTQARIVKKSCASALVSGFSSSALGSPHNYPSDEASQRNLALAAGVGGNLWCQTGSEWGFLPHTASQVSSVQSGLFTMIQSTQTKYASLLSSIKSAATVAAVEAIVW